VAFFKALAAIGIGRDELADVSNESLIRIEKKLIAEQKLNNSISKNDVETVLRVLKDYPDVLKEVARYNCFYGILTGYDAEYIDTLAHYSPEQADRIKLVVSNYFNDEIIEYINVNLAQNNWNNIRVLLHYRIFFNNDIIKVLTTRLEAKMEFGITTLQQGGAYINFIKKIDYIGDKEFYFTLGDVDKRHFLRLIVTMIDLINLSPAYLSDRKFFPQVKQAMQWYDTSNTVLVKKLGLQKIQQHVATGRSRGQVSTARTFYFIIVVMIVTYNLSRSCNNQTSYNPTFVTATSPWSNIYDSEAGEHIDSVRQIQRDKMEDFAEARLYPVNYPVDTLKAGLVKINKYGNPFALDIFSGSYNYVKNRVPRIAIVNNTHKECVVIAYFRERFDVSLNAYTRIDNVNSIDIYAFYIPPHDSINVDKKMELLRFYMGQKLAAFNTYRQHVYPDSLDAKFSKFTPADSMLFSKAFFGEDALVNKHARTKKLSLLTISQPSQTSYLLSWTGNTPLYQETDWMADVTGKYPDSIDTKKPLLLELKNQPATKSEIRVNSFIYK